MKHKIVTIGLFVLTIAVLGLALTPNAYAANQVVSDCGDNGGADQLRAKLSAAQSNGGGAISFTCGPNIILNGTALPTITSNITINGGGILTLSGGNASRLFVVNSGATLTLNDLTITKGKKDGDAGAIHSSGTLNINRSKFTDNHTTANGSGGAIAAFGALNITDSEFSFNTSANGGALYVKWGNAVATISDSNFHDNETLDLLEGWGGALLLFDGGNASFTNTKFTDNKAGYGGAAYVYANSNSTLTLTTSTVQSSSATYGGGIYNNTGTVNLTDSTLSLNSTTGGNGGGLLNLGTMTLLRSTIAGNTSYTGLGGGIYNIGTLNVTNSTLSGNAAAGNLTPGGAIYNNSGSLNITNSTFANNSATYGAGGIGAPGGSVTIKNTLFAHGAQGTNCAGWTGGAFNLSDDTSCSFGTGRDNINLLLGALANNGGATFTHLPQTGSPAIDNGTISGCPSTDQRSLPRPKGTSCEVGSVEIQPATPPTNTPTRTATGTPTPAATSTPTHTSTPTSAPATQTPTNGCGQSPAKPTLKEPATNTTLTTAKPKLKWNAATCANTYTVFVLDAKTGAVKQQSAALTKLNWKTATLAKGKYKWYVQACNTAGCTKSAKWVLTIK